MNDALVDPSLWPTSISHSHSQDCKRFWLFNYVDRPLHYRHHLLSSSTILYPYPLIRSLPSIYGPAQYLESLKDGTQLTPSLQLQRWYIHIWVVPYTVCTVICMSLTQPACSVLVLRLWRSLRDHNGTLAFRFRVEFGGLGIGEHSFHNLVCHRIKKVLYSSACIKEIELNQR